MQSLFDKKLIVFLLFVVLGISGSFLFLIAADQEVHTMDAAENEQLPAIFQENYLMLYYTASGRDFSAILDPDAQIPDVMKEALKNKIDQRCMRINEDPNEYFYYRILDENGQVISSNYETYDEKAALTLRARFDEQGEAVYEVNGKRVSSDTEWAIPQGMDALYMIYDEITQSIAFESYGILDSQQQTIIKEELFENLRRPLPANVTYEIFIDDSSIYIETIKQTIYEKYQGWYSLYLFMLYPVLALIGIALFSHSCDLLKKKIFWIGRNVPLFLQVSMFIFLWILLINTQSSFFIIFSFKDLLALFSYGILLAYSYVNLLLACYSYRQENCIVFLCRYSIFARVFYKFKEKKNIWSVIALSLASLSILVFCILLLSTYFLSIIPISCVVAFLLTVFMNAYKQMNKEYNQMIESLSNMSPITEQCMFFSSLKEKVNNSQQMFEKAVEDEVRSQRMKTELITNVSHDLKTPLTSLRGYVDLLKQDNLNEDQRLYLEKITFGVERLTTLIEDLLDVSRADSGNLILNKEAIVISDLIQQVVLERECDLSAKGLQIRYEGLEESKRIYGDSEKIYRIFDNLIGNCVKYAMADTRIYIVITKDEQMVRVCIKNISAYEIHFDAREILERFVRGDASRTSEGSGLGLAIVRSFAKAQDGDFFVEIDGDLFKAIIMLPLFKEEEG